MTLADKLGKRFVITTELGPVKGVLTNESLEKARTYLPLDGINIHDCPMGNLRINSVSMASLIQNSLKVEALPHFTSYSLCLLWISGKIPSLKANSIAAFYMGMD